MLIPQAIVESGGAITDVGAQIRRTTNQAIGNGTTTAVSFDTEDYDTDGFFAGGNPTRLTIPSGLGGTYIVSGVFWWQTGNNSTMIGVRKNGNDTIIANSEGQEPNLTNARNSICGVMRLVADEYIELCAWQNSGGDRTLLNDVGDLTTDPIFTLQKIV